MKFLQVLVSPLFIELVFMGFGKLHTNLLSSACEEIYISVVFSDAVRSVCYDDFSFQSFPFDVICQSNVYLFPWQWTNERCKCQLVN